jgi:peptide deformylase
MTIRNVIPKTALSLKPSRAVIDFSDKYVQQSIQDLKDSLVNIQAEIDKTRPEAVGGVGLAANQIEYPNAAYPQDFVPFNIYVVNVRPLRARKENCQEVELSVYINATFVPVEDTESKQLITSEYTEGCLSITGIFAPKTPRSENILLTYSDAQGVQHKLAADGFVARVHQHELDHGLGKEFLNHLNFTESELYKICKWLGQRKEVKPGDWILEGKLQIAFFPAGFDALCAWVTHEIQKKAPSLLVRATTDNDLFGSCQSPAAMVSPSSSSTTMSPSTPPGDNESMGIGKLRIN